MTQPRRSGLLMILAAIGLALLAASPLTARPQQLKTETIEVVTHQGARRFTVEIADTEAARNRGLMFRKYLAADRGMLFEFHPPQSVSFWMKNTLIPLDMLFINSDDRVISIAREATPLSEAQISSGGDVREVLELRGGRAAEIGARIGDLVRQRALRH